MVTAVETPAPFVLRTWVPVYDDRDAVIGHRGYDSKMRYGTVAGALARMMLDHSDEHEVGMEILDTRTGTPVGWREIEAVRTKARKQNAWSRFGCNDKDGIPF